MPKRFVLLGLIALLLEVGISLHLFSRPVPRTEKVLFVPDPEYIKCISGTFRPLFAQVFFMKGVLEFANNPSEKMDYLFAMFLACLQIDPHLRSAAFFGGVVLPQQPEEIKRGIALLEQARKLLPDEWRIPYWIGVDYYQLEDFEKAAEYYKKASLMPGSPDFLKTNLALLFFKAHDLQSALLYFEGLKESVKDEALLEMIQARIDWLQGIWILEQKVDDYRRTYGQWPASLQDLVTRGLLREIPQDPYGDGFYLERSIEAGTERCRVRSRF